MAAPSPEQLRPVEQNPTSAVKCSDCKSDFTLFRWKYLCRACGFYFCSECSPWRRPIPKFGYNTPQRVCTHCYIAILLEGNDVALLTMLAGHQLKSFAQARSVNVADCLEKTDIIQRLRAQAIAPAIPPYLHTSANRMSSTSAPPGQYATTYHGHYPPPPNFGYPQPPPTAYPSQPARPVYTSQPPPPSTYSSQPPPPSAYPSQPPPPSAYPGAFRQAPGQSVYATPYYTAVPGRGQPVRTSPPPPSQGVPTVRPPPSRVEEFTTLENMRTSELQAILRRYNVSAEHILEKRELVAKVREALATQEQIAGSSASGPSRGGQESTPTVNSPPIPAPNPSPLNVSSPNEPLVSETGAPSPSPAPPIPTPAVSSSNPLPSPPPPAQTASESKPPSSPSTLDDEEDACVICLDEKIATVFLECGHMACCVACSTKLVSCPICRRPIVRVVNVYHATK